jgi:hypothetical protein
MLASTIILKIIFQKWFLIMVSNQRSKTTWEEEAKWIATRGEEEERDFKIEVHKKQKTSKPYTYFSQKGEIIINKDN